MQSAVYPAATATRPDRRHTPRRAGRASRRGRTASRRRSTTRYNGAPSPSPPTERTTGRLRHGSRGAGCHQVSSRYAVFGVQRGRPAGRGGKRGVTPIAVAEPVAVRHPRPGLRHARGCRTAGRPAKGVAPTGRAARLRSNQAPGGDPEPRPAPPTCNGKPGPSPQPEHGTNVRSYAMEPDRLGDRLLPRPIRMQAVAAPQPYVGREP